MKRMRFVLLAVLLLGLLAGCKAKEMENMRWIQDSEGSPYIMRDGQAYTIHGFVGDSLVERQIGIMDDDKNHKIYSVKGYDDSEWLIEYMDVIMPGPYRLYKNETVTEIPEELALSDDAGDPWLKNAGNDGGWQARHIISRGITHALIAFVQVILFIGRLFIG